MNKKIVTFLIIIIAIGVLGVAGLAWAADYGTKTTAGAAGLTSYGTSIPTIIGNALGAVLSFVGVLFFGLMLYGGIMWMTSRGNQETEKKALNTILAAVIGIIIVLGSYAITTFVFSNVIKGGSSTSSVTTPTVTTPTNDSAPTPQITTPDPNPPVIPDPVTPPVTATCDTSVYTIAPAGDKFVYRCLTEKGWAQGCRIKLKTDGTGSPLGTTNDFKVTSQSYLAKCK